MRIPPPPLELLQATTAMAAQAAHDDKKAFMVFSWIGARKAHIEDGTRPRGLLGRRDSLRQTSFSGLRGWIDHAPEEVFVLDVWFEGEFVN